MAEQRSRRSSQNGSGRRSQNGSGGNSRSRLSGRDVVERVRRELPEMLGHPVESVLGLESGDSKGWSVTVQVVELSRVPHSTDVLGSYEVTLDKDGEVQSYKRRRRYYRNQADED